MKSKIQVYGPRVTSLLRSQNLPLAVLGAVWLFVFHPLLFHPGELLLASDLIRFYEPLAAFTFDAVRAGEGLPLWNPHVFLGQGWIENERMVFLYPPMWLLLVLPAGLGLSFLLAAHVLLSGLSMQALLRGLGRSAWVAAFGGVAWMLSGPLLGHTFAGHLEVVLGAPYLPLAGLFFLRLLREPSARRAVALGATLAALVFTGSVQLLLMLLASFAVSGALRAWSGRRQKAEESPSGSSLRRWVGLAALTGACAMGLAGARWLPLVSGLSSWPVPVEDRAGYAASFSMPARDGIRLVLPYAFGEPRPGAADRENLFFWETTPYAGVLPFALALLALTTVRNRRELRFPAAVSGVALLFALAAPSVVFGLFLRLVPGLDHFPVASRSLFFFVGGLIVLGTASLEELTKASPVSRGMIRNTACLGALLILSVVVLGALVTEGVLPERGFLQGGAFLLAAGALLLIGAASSRRARWLRGSVFALTALELVLVARPLIETSPKEKLETVPAFLGRLEEKSETRILDLSHFLPQELTLERGITKTLGYDPRAPKDFVRIFNRLFEPYMPEVLEAAPQELPQIRHFGILDLLGASFVISRREMEGPGPLRMVDHADVSREVLRGSKRETTLTIPLSLYENPAAMPPAYFVPEVRVFEEREKILEELEYLEPRRYACLEKRASEEEFFGNFQAVELTWDGTDRVHLELELDCPRYLILTQRFDPGWKATSNGASLELLRANYGLQALFLEAGSHHVELTYRPTSWLVGLSLTGTTLVLLGGAWILAIVQRRRRRTRDAISSELTPSEEDTIDEDLAVAVLQ